jgi:hypothetical protein
MYTAAMKHIGAAVVFLVLFSAPGWGQSQIVAQVVDGGVWQTTMVVTNTTAGTAHASLSFFKDTTNYATQTWNLTFLESASTSPLTLAAGETRLLHTPGTASTLTQGWGLIAADPGVNTYAIFTQRQPGLAPQVGTSPASAAATRILVPFDNTSGNVAAMAIVNPTGAPITVNVNVRTTAGAVSQYTLPALPAQGHAAFTFPQQLSGTAGVSGVAEFYTSAGTFSILALSFTGLSSTTAPVYNQTGPPILSGSGTASSVTFAGFAIGKVTSGAGFPPLLPESGELVSGQFGVYTAAGWALPYSAPMVDLCSVFDRSYAVGGKDPSVFDSTLDAGPSIAVSGPNLPVGSALTRFSLPSGPLYALTPTQGTLALGGTYTISGSGGSQVGSFNKSATLPSSFTVTNWDSITTLSRSSPLTINWTGSGFDQIVITIRSLVRSGSNETIVDVTCPIAANLGSYTVPAAAMGMLLATTTGSFAVTARPNGGGTLNAVSTNSQNFTPSLVGGGTINYGDFSPFLAAIKILPIQ